MPKDIVSSKPTDNNPPSRARRVLNAIRSPLTKLAVKMANDSTFEMVSHQNATPPIVGNKGIDATGKVVADPTQLATETFNFTPSGVGGTQSIEGFRIPAQQGKPTIVFFGGSEFDRTSQHYQDSIRRMASDAKAKGMGFAVYDYPQGMTAQRMDEYVTAVQGHLVNQGVTMDLQAYSGFSLGSYPAMRAANTNQQCAGVHILSGFSSARMAQKEGMGKLGALVDKSKLDTVMDVALEARGLRTRLGQDGAGQMPISLAYSDKEEFGKANNRHMTPVINELLGNNSPGLNSPNGSVKCSVNTDPKKSQPNPHMGMLSSMAEYNSFRDFVDDTASYVHTQQQQLAQQNAQQNVQQVVVPQQQVAPQQQAPTTTVQSQSQSVSDEDGDVALSTADDDRSLDQSQGTSQDISSHRSVRDSMRGEDATTQSKGLKRSQSDSALTSKESEKPGSLRQSFKRGELPKKPSQSSLHTT